MKARIERVTTIGEENAYFKVYADDKLVKVLSFREDAIADSIFNEEKNKIAAIALAKQIEGLDSLEQKKTIYETIYETQ